MAQVFAGAAAGGRFAQRRGNDVAAAVGRLFRKAAPNKRALKKELMKAAEETRQVIALKAVSRTTIDKPGALRRIRLIAARKPGKAIVSLVTYPKSRTIHAGRLNITATGNNVRSIPGGIAAGAFLFKPQKYTGRERRVYRRHGKDLIAIQHTREMGDFYRSSVGFAARRVAYHTLKQRAKQAAKAKAAGLQDYQVGNRLRIKESK